MDQAEFWHMIYPIVVRFDFPLEFAVEVASRATQYNYVPSGMTVKAVR